MAQKVNIVLIDDIDGSDATQTVAFGIDGANYEIDLNDKNAGKLRDALAPYVGHARKTGRATGGGRKTSRSSSGGASASDIREWARGAGYDVPARGRIPADVRAAYEAAN